MLCQAGNAPIFITLGGFPRRHHLSELPAGACGLQLAFPGLGVKTPKLLSRLEESLIFACAEMANVLPRCESKPYINRSKKELTRK